MKQDLFSDALLRNVLCAARTVAWSWNLTTGEWACSGDLAAIFGVASDSLHGKIEDFYRHVHPYDRDRVREILHASVRSTESFDADFRSWGPDGTGPRVRMQGSIRCAESGDSDLAIGLIVAAAEDSSSTKLSEAVFCKHFFRFRQFR